MFRGTDLLTCPRNQLRGYQGDDIGIVFQEPMTSLNPVYRIGWQVEESLRIHRPSMSREDRKGKAMECSARWSFPIRSEFTIPIPMKYPAARDSVS